MYSDRQAWANSETQMRRRKMWHLIMVYTVFPPLQLFLDTTLGSKFLLFKFKKAEMSEYLG